MFGVDVEDTIVCTYCYAISPLFWTIVVVSCVCKMPPMRWATTSTHEHERPRVALK